MLLSHICPIKYIPTLSGDFIMALSNYIDRNKVNDYEKAILKTGKPIYLDNGAFETGFPDGIDALFTKAERLNPKYIFTPDYLGNSERTYISLGHFEYIKKQLKLNYQTAVIPQANNTQDYLDFFQDLDKNPKVKLIGLSYMGITKALKYKTKSDVPKKEKRPDLFDTPNYTEDRIIMLEKINELNPQTPVHLLGLGESYKDLLTAKEKYPWVISNDTSTCFMAGYYEKRITDNLKIPGGKIKEKIDIKINKLNNNQRKIIVNNINKINKKLCINHN